MDTQTTKELLNAPQRGEIILYQTADGRTKIDVKLENETVWLTQAQIAALMGTNVPAISKHISNIYKQGELDTFVSNHPLGGPDGIAIGQIQKTLIQKQANLMLMTEL